MTAYFFSIVVNIGVLASYRALDLTSVMSMWQLIAISILLSSTFFQIAYLTKVKERSYLQISLLERSSGILFLFSFMLVIYLFWAGVYVSGKEAYFAGADNNGLIAFGDLFIVFIKTLKPYFALFFSFYAYACILLFLSREDKRDLFIE